MYAVKALKIATDDEHNQPPVSSDESTRYDAQISNERDDDK